MTTSLRTGIDVLCREHADWMAGARVGLVCHPASRSADGTHSSTLLHRAIGSRLRALFGPEHGVTGRAGAGEIVAHSRHAAWDIPVHSLYGETRKPTARMLRGIDIVVFDLQDIAARPYTYGSTLRYLLEAVAEQRKRVIVADRPDPLAGVVDGPPLSRSCESFVGLIPSPTVYGMTPGETALWLRRALRLDVDVRVATIPGYRRARYSRRGWCGWVPPSPAIVSWQSALCFPITVFFEALPALDHGRGTAEPFRRFGAPWIDAEATCSALNRMQLPGLAMKPCRYRAKLGLHAGKIVEGCRFTVTHPAAFRPVRTAVSILHLLQEQHGKDTLWNAPGTRPGFFDQLMGTRRVRRQLRSGASGSDIASEWNPSRSAFMRKREDLLLYR